MRQEQFVLGYIGLAARIVVSLIMESLRILGKLIFGGIQIFLQIQEG